MKLATAVVLAVPTFAAIPVYAQTAIPNHGFESAAYSNSGVYEKSVPAQPSEPPRPTPRAADGKPDLSGVWLARNKLPNHGVPSGKLPYTAAGQEAYQHNLSKEVDPQSLCILIGEPRAILDG